MDDKNSPQSAVLGASGEYLVLSNLLRLNFVAGKAPENTKDYDLIVLNKDGTSSFPIQVKTTFVKDGWMLGQKHEKPIKNLIFCFVKLSKDTNKSEIYVVDSKVVANSVKTSHKIWLKLPGKKGQKHKDTSMRRLMRDYKANFTKIKNYKEYLSKDEVEFINQHSQGWLDKYKDAWHIIKN